MKKLLSVIVLLVIIFSVMGKTTSNKGLNVSRAIAMEKVKDTSKILKPPAPPPAPTFPDIDPNDPYYATCQWNLMDDGDTFQGGTSYFGIQAPKAWKALKAVGVEGGLGIKIAIIDSGVAYEDYTIKNGRTILRSYKKATDFKNTTFDTINARDFSTDVPGGTVHANDDYGNGTYMCGIIAASTNDSYGCAGIAYKATILPIKVYGYKSNTTYPGTHWKRRADAIIYAADKGAKVIVLGFVGDPPTAEYYNPADETLVHDAITYAHEKGSVIVVPAYTLSTTTDPYRGYLVTDETIHVSNARFDGTITSLSKTGPLIDLVAPCGTTDDLTGDNCMEKILQESFETYFWNSTTGTYDYRFNQDFFFKWSTDGKAPVAHVAAVAALVMSIHPTWTPEQVKAALIGSTKKKAGLTYPNETYGYGSLDAYGAVTYTP